MRPASSVFFERTRIATIAVLLACTSVCPAAAIDVDEIKVVAPRTPIQVPPTATSTLGIGRFVSAIPATEEVFESHADTFCASRRMMSWSQVAPALASQTAIVLKRELAMTGYQVPPVSDQIYDTGKPQQPDLQLGVRIKAFRMNTCSHSGEIKGAMYLDTHWEVFDPRLQKVVASLDVEGSYRLDSRQEMRPTDFLERGVTAVIHNLLADPRLVEAATPKTGAADTVVDASNTFHFATVAPPDGGLQKNMTQVRAAVVTVEAGGASGSGFYVSKQGYVLTDKHVVGANGFVKVRTATGREIPGEVIASDSQRDVALIKIEALPFEPLALQRQDPNVGDDVYAIGSPLGDTFNGTLTKGVMSGFRTVNDLRFIQSDVSILPGSSGGPLLDSRGRVIGLAVIAVMPGRGGNLNFFVPIGEALDRLHITIDR